MDDYNLLPHQKAILRALVEDYLSNEANSPEFIITGSAKGVSVVWLDNRGFEYSPQKSEGDFSQLANEGLLGMHQSSKGNPIYQITQTSIEAVGGTFPNDGLLLTPHEASPLTPEIPGDQGAAIEIRGSGADIIRGTSITLHTEHQKQEFNPQVAAAIIGATGTILAAIIGGYFLLKAANLPITPVVPPPPSQVELPTATTSLDPYVAPVVKDCDLAALNETTNIEYDPVGNVVATTDSEGNRTTYSYDEVGNLVSVTDPLGHTIQCFYDERGLLISFRDSKGAETFYTYDAAGHLIQVIDPQGFVFRYEYDQQGNIVVVVDPLGNEYHYDKDGNLIDVE